MHIPQEIIDQIITELDDKRTLCSCSLVCSQWLPTAQSQLFQDISISTRNVSRFLELASVNDSFFRRTSGLHLYIRENDIPGCILYPQDLSLLRACHITKLALNSSGGPADPTTLKHLATFIASTLPEVIELDIVYLSAVPANMMENIARALPNLQKLTYTTINIPQVTETFSRFPTWPKLRVINILKCLSTSTFHRWLLAIVPFPAIEIILVAGLRHRPGVPSLTYQLLERSASTLVDLSIFCHIIHPQDPSVVTLPPIPSLRALHCIELTIFNFGETSLIPLSHLIASITSPHIESVVLRFSSISVPYLCMADWAEIDDILAGGRFSSLKRFQVIIPRHGELPFPHEGSSFFAERMPRCQLRNILEVTRIRHHSS
ncbi:hypothetical protein HGRIS_006028 [Hohenbuehelia grisea]|uniref:F-box domain-containing protein n=1 Tax=Hohenbuehelia grisea TaxID=104357 RepID=A0ABR3JYJ9_9AGAR